MHILLPKTSAREINLTIFTKICRGSLLCTNVWTVLQSPGNSTNWHSLSLCAVKHQSCILFIMLYLRFNQSLTWTDVAAYIFSLSCILLWILLFCSSVRKWNWWVNTFEANWDDGSQIASKNEDAGDIHGTAEILTTLQFACGDSCSGKRCIAYNKWWYNPSDTWATKCIGTKWVSWVLYIELLNWFLLPCVLGAQSCRLSLVDAHTVALTPVHGKITRHYSRYCAVAFCCTLKCELSYRCPGHDHKLHPHRVNLYRIGCVGSGFVAAKALT